MDNGIQSSSLTQSTEKRRAERVKAAMPVRWAGGHKGLTRDISATGLFFETSGKYRKGSRMDLTVELDTPAGKLQLNCQGKIVRLEKHGAKVGVAVKITDSVLSYAQVR